MTDVVPSQVAEKVKVLYMMGWGRNGSTILGNVLGELGGFVHVGELRALWRKATVSHRHCGCGFPVGQCSVWARVLESTAFAGPAGDDIRRWYSQELRVRHLRRLIRMVPQQPTGRSNLDMLIASMDRLYCRIAAMNDARVIVDTSKRVLDAALLRLLPSVSAYLVLLVRDPRASAYSWQRRKVTGEGDRQMPRHGPIVSTRNWVTLNLAAQALIRRHDPHRSVLVRYEDFVAAPERVVAQLTNLVGETPRHSPFSAARVVNLAAKHTIGGNPVRFTTGSVEIREDDEWRTRQRSVDRLLSTTVALPWLRHFGYPLAVKR